MVRQLLSIATMGFLLLSCGNDEKPQVQTIPAVPSAQKTMDSISAQIAKARDFEDKGQAEEALKIVDAMLQRYPGELDAMGIKADILKAQGKEAEALALLQKAYRLQPKDKETAYNLAYEYADTKNPNALALTDTLIKYDKTETVARAWYTKAHYYNQLRNDKEAMRYDDSAIIADYNFLDAYLDKGQIQYRQKAYNDALKTFAIGQKISPASAEFYLWVAKTQEAMGNKGDAKTNYERAYALDKTLTDAKEAAEKL